MFFTGVYANLTRRFLHPEIPRWRTNTGSSYNLVTGRYINVMSAVTTVFGHARSTSTGIDIVRLRRSIRYKSEVKTVPQTGSTNNLTKETYRSNLSGYTYVFGG